MKRSGLWAAGVVLLAGVGVLTGAAGAAEGATATCSVATLRGMYLFEGARAHHRGRGPRSRFPRPAMRCMTARAP